MNSGKKWEECIFIENNEKQWSSMLTGSLYDERILNQAAL